MHWLVVRVFRDMSLIKVPDYRLVVRVFRDTYLSLVPDYRLVVVSIHRTPVKQVTAS